MAPESMYPGSVYRDGRIRRGIAARPGHARGCAQKWAQLIARLHCNLKPLNKAIICWTIVQSVHRIGSKATGLDSAEHRHATGITIMAARQFAQQYEWEVHYPLALSAGLPAGINRRPPLVGLSAHCAIREPIRVERPQPQFIADSHRDRHPGVRRIRGAARELGNSHRPGIDRRSDIAS
jgi:hypothetical protein